MLPRWMRSRDRDPRSAPRLALRPLLAGALTLFAAACSDPDRPGFSPTSEGETVSSALVYGTVRLPGTLEPVPGGLVRTLVSRSTCDGGVIKRGPETFTNAAGEYQLEVIVDSPPFEGCVWLEVDFDLTTIRPDTTIYRPGVKFGRGLPPRETVRIDVTLANRRTVIGVP